MTRARKDIAPPGQRAFYHTMSRCARWAYICGKDPVSGADYSHREKWIEARMWELSSVFSISVYAWAILNNHLHVVLRVCPEHLKRRSGREVAEAWRRIDKTLRTREELRLRKRQETEADLRERDERVLDLLRNPAEMQRIRKKFCSMSDYMTYLKEPVSKRANQEDNCRGPFWESRFKSKALLDEGGILSRMTCADLNALSAGLAEELKDSRYTSINWHIRVMKNEPGLANRQLRPLFGPGSDPSENAAIPRKAGSRYPTIHWKEY